MNQLFAQRRNLFRPRHFRMLAAITRFNREAVTAITNPHVASMTLGEYVAARRYGSDFLNLYLVPMSAAVWSTPFRQVLDFPAMTLLTFFHNHGFLGMNTQHPWRTVAGGSRVYVEKVTRPFRNRITMRAAVSVSRTAHGAVIKTDDGEQVRVDHVILATHADEALALLTDQTADERRLLSPFRYQKNIAQLHTDASVMPRSRRAWASWNYRITGEDDRAHGSTVYWMNSLQGLQTARNYFVSIDDPGTLDPATVIRSITYEHPLFTREAIAGQAALATLNGSTPSRTTFFCGSYFGYGFHEDAFRSAVHAASALLSRRIERYAA